MTGPSYDLALGGITRRELDGAAATHSDLNVQRSTATSTQGSLVLISLRTFSPQIVLIELERFFLHQNLPEHLHHRVAILRVGLLAAIEMGIQASKYASLLRPRYQHTLNLAMLP